jgi:hypothetical protein
MVTDSGNSSTSGILQKFIDASHPPMAHIPKTFHTFDLKYHRKGEFNKKIPQVKMKIDSLLED